MIVSLFPHLNGQIHLVPVPVHKEDCLPPYSCTSTITCGKNSLLFSHISTTRRSTGTDRFNSTDVQIYVECVVRFRTLVDKFGLVSVGIAFRCIHFVVGRTLSSDDPAIARRPVSTTMRK